MEIKRVDLERGIVYSNPSISLSQFNANNSSCEWRIVSNNSNQYLLLEREANGRFHAAEADLRKNLLHEVLEITYRGPNGETFVFDPASGVIKI